MPKTISYVKMVKILHHYFSGMPQLGIAQKCLVNQSTVSRGVEKFRKEASAKGIIAAAKEYQVMDEVSALRSLATELYKSKVSIKEAKAGLKMVALFNSLNVAPEEYKVLAKMFKKLKDPEFPKAGTKLVKLEESTGKEYVDLVDEFEKLGEEIAERQEKIADLQEKQGEVEKALEALELERKGKEEEVAEFMEEAGKEKAAADAEVKEKLTEAGLTLKKIAKLHPVVENMNALGISDDDIETFVGERQDLEEKGVTWEKFKTVAGALAKAGEIDGDDLVEKLAEFGTLDKTITSMKAEEASLQPEVVKLGKEKMKLTADVDGLIKSKDQLKSEVGPLEGSKKALSDTIEILKKRSAHLESHVAALENDITDFVAKKISLIEEVNQKQLEISEMNKQLKEADTLSQTLVKKQLELQELDARIAAAGQNYELYKAFLGLVSERKETQIKNFLNLALVLLEKSKLGEFDPGFLVDTILTQLSGNILDKLGCDYCGAEFVMLRRRQKVLQDAGLTDKTPMHCPDCGGFLKMVVKTPLGSTLKKVIIKGKPTLKVPGITLQDQENTTDPEASK